MEDKESLLKFTQKIINHANRSDVSSENLAEYILFILKTTNSSDDA